MKIKELLKDIEGVFVPPKKYYYFGKIAYGTPYFNPWNFESTVIRIRRLKLKTKEQLEEYIQRYTYLRNDPSTKYSNFPMVRRNKHWIVRLFKQDWLIFIGFPFAIAKVHHGWKDKFESPRHEWVPSFQIYFLKWQFCIWWNAPLLEGEKYPDNDLYYEMILWWRNYCDRDIKKAEKTWKWIDVKTKKSTWDDRYLRSYAKNCV